MKEPSMKENNKILTTKMKCPIVEWLENDTYILLKDKVYSIENSKLKESNGAFASVEYIVNDGNIEFI